MAKLARRGRLKICYIRNVVGSNPTCGTTLDSRVIGHGLTLNQVLFSWVTYS